MGDSDLLPGSPLLNLKTAWWWAWGCRAENQDRRGTGTQPPLSVQLLPWYLPSLHCCGPGHLRSPVRTGWLGLLPGHLLCLCLTSLPGREVILVTGLLRTQSVSLLGSAGLPRRLRLVLDKRNGLVLANVWGMVFLFSLPRKGWLVTPIDPGSPWLRSCLVDPFLCRQPVACGKTYSVLLKIISSYSCKPLGLDFSLTYILFHPCVL